MKTDRKVIDEFLQQKTIAVVGVSRNKDKSGSAIYRELKKKGYKVFAVNPKLDMFEGDRCYAGLGALPELPGGVVIVIPPESVVPVIEEAARLGISQVWVQLGADSIEAEKRGNELGLKLINGDCIFMFIEPVESIHKFHRFLAKIFGGYPSN